MSFCSIPKKLETIQRARRAQDMISDMTIRGNGKVGMGTHSVLKVLAQVHRMYSHSHWFRLKECADESSSSDYVPMKSRL